MNHPLHSADFIERYRDFAGEPLQERRTGRSTALALKYIAEAIQNPRKPVQIKDHHDSALAHRRLFQVTREMVKRLDLQNMVFHEFRGTVTLTD